MIMLPLTGLEISLLHLLHNSLIRVIMLDVLFADLFLFVSLR